MGGAVASMADEAGFWCRPEESEPEDVEEETIENDGHDGYATLPKSDVSFG